MPRTALFNRQLLHGFNDYVNFAKHPAGIFFVGSTVAGAANRADFGSNPDTPFLNLTYAIGQATDSVGDVIYLLPGHVETVTAAAGLVFNKIGLTVIGIGEGALRPIIRLTTINTADVDFDAASVTIENVEFQAGRADIVAALDINATDVTLRRCRFVEQGANLNALIWIQDAAAAGSDRITVEDCVAIDVDAGAAGTHFINFAGTGTEHIFRRNTLIGDWGTMAIGGAGVVTRATVCDNYVYNIATDADCGINFAATATGVMFRNLVCTGHASASSITAQGFAKCQNYGGIIADSNGLLEPIAT